MRTLSFLFGLMFAMAYAHPAAAADDARSILEKAVKAHGGADTLAKMKGGQSQNKGKMKLPGIGDVEFTQEILYLLPDKFKESLNLEINNQNVTVTTIVNGDQVSISAGGMDVPINDDIKKALKDAREMLQTARLVSLLTDKSYQLSVIGEVKVEGKAAVGIHVESKGKKDVNLFFDKESGLLAKLEFRSVSPATQKEVTEERIILEYRKKEKSDPPVPKKVIVRHDGETFLEAEVVEAKLLETVDESEFKK